MVVQESETKTILEYKKQKQISKDKINIIKKKTC